MKPQRLYDTKAPRKAVNLSANSDLLQIAKRSGINLSSTFEEAVIAKLKAAQSKEWLEENREAINSYNSRIEQYGVFGSTRRRF